MAFPVVETTATTNGTGATASAVVNLPTGIVSGDLLIVLHRNAVGTEAHGYPAGWTVLFNEDLDASNDRISSAWRRADGTEGASITVTQTSSKFASIAYRISGAGDPQISSRATGTSTTPNPPSFTPAGGAQDYLWLWIGGWEGEQTSPPAFPPTNYTSLLGADSGTAGVIATNCRVASAQRALNAATEDPGGLDISTSDDWTAAVIATPPAPPPPPGPAAGLRTLALMGVGV